MMLNSEEYRKKVLKTMIDALQPRPDILAVWEGGSAATGTKDQYSDIDLCVLANSAQRPILDHIQKSLEVLNIEHTWQTQKSFFGEGLMQRVIILKDSPKFFLIDVGVFDQNHPQLLKEFLEVERHGEQIIYFDKIGVIKQGHTDAAEVFKKHKLRVDELNDGFVVYKSLVLKEIARGKAIDAIAFYQSGLVRPLVEIMGMIYRPFKSDFGLRYLHKDFPEESQDLIKQLMYVSSVEDLSSKIPRLEKAFHTAIQQFRSKTTLV